MSPDRKKSPPPRTSPRNRTAAPTTAPSRSLRPRATSPVAIQLAPLSALYGLGARVRARSWRGRQRRLPHPVLSVGNLTFGGTGKTPLVIHAAQALQRRGLRVAILSRGYRAGPGGVNDEARVIARHAPEALHVQDPDRYAAGTRIAGEADVYVLDDGFQHHPLHRDADLVLIDATDPFGGGWCPPGGRLREPLRALERATLVLLTRCGLVPRDTLGGIMREVRARTEAPLVTSRFVPECETALEGLDVSVACGIGNPRAFLATVESLGARVVRHRFFCDHHAFDAADAAALARPGLPVVVTEKDAVKLEPLWSGDVPLHVVRIRFEALEGAGELDALLGRIG